MEDSQNQNSTSQKNSGSSSAGKIVAVVVITVLVLAILGLIFVNSSVTNKLKRELSQAQNELNDIRNEQTEAENELAQELQEGVQEIAEEITDLDSPLARFILTKAYASQLRDLLTPDGVENLDKIIVYVEKTPTVLVQPNPTLPTEISQAVQDLKSEVATLRASSVATSVETVNSQVGQSMTITGVLAEVSEDTILGGSVFKITTTEGEEYYLQLSDTNAVAASKLVGEEVEAIVEITGSENGLVTYDVVTGPTAVNAVPTATPTGTPTATP